MLPVRFKLDTRRPPPLEERDAPHLHAVLDRLAATAGIPKPRLVLVDSPDLNAFALGLSPRKATIGVTSGLLSICAPAEVEGVLAHEISHLTNNDTRVTVLVMAVPSVLMAVATGGLALAAGGAATTPRNPDDDDSSGGMALIAGGIALAAVAGIGWGVALLLRLAVSRRRELMADATAVQLLGDGTGLRRALERMATHTATQSPVTSATAHMWIHAPVGEPRPGWFRTLWATHPPFESRIALLRRLDPAAGRIAQEVFPPAFAACDQAEGALPTAPTSVSATGAPTTGATSRTPWA